MEEQDRCPFCGKDIKSKSSPQTKLWCLQSCEKIESSKGAAYPYVYVHEDCLKNQSSKLKDTIEVVATIFAL